MLNDEPNPSILGTLQRLLGVGCCPFTPPVVMVYTGQMIGRTPSFRELGRVTIMVNAIAEVYDDWEE